MDIEKIRMMTRLAIFEKKEGKEIQEISRYFKGDYVSYQIFKGILHYSLCFLLLLLIALLIQLETILLNLNFQFLGQALKLFLVVYGTGLLITVVLAGFTASSHYDRSHDMGEVYAEHLEKLLSYEESGRAVSYARNEAASYMKRYMEEPEGGWLDEEEEEDAGPDIDVVNISNRGNRNAVH